MCKISVVTSVYNCEEYIGETIASVLNQTFEDWEFIIINDASNDRSAEIIKSFKDPRIVYINNTTNKGQCANLNSGIRIAKGEYIARLDHDDICHPKRFEKQLEYLEKNEEVVLLGTHSKHLVDDVLINLPEIPFLTYNELSFAHTFFNYCMAHSSFMFRREIIIEHSIWYDDYLYAEDYSLLLRMLKVGKIACLREPLITYRIFPEQCTQVYGEEMKEREKNEIRCNYLASIEIETKYLQKAVKNELRTFYEYNKFCEEFEQIVQFYKLNNIKGTSERNVVKLVYNDLIYRQKRNAANIVTYLLGKYRDVKKIKSFFRNSIKNEIWRK